MRQTKSNQDKKSKQVPMLKGEKAIAKFWDTHDAADYWDSMEELDEPLVLDPRLEKRIMERHKKRLLTMRLEQGQISDARRVAAKKGIGYQTLLRVWIQAGIQQEWKSRLAGRVSKNFER